MATFKLVIGLKNGKSVQKEVKDNDADVFLGKKINESIKGDSCGFPGYEFKVMGGSDFCGFPMRLDVQGAIRKKVTVISGVGVKKKGKGIKQKKTVCGNTINDKIVQINLKVTKEGAAPLYEEKPEEKKEGAA